MYGGLGTRERFGLSDTAHYLAPLVAWAMPGGLTLCVSPTFGLNSSSHRFMVRLGVSYEIPNFGRRGE